MLGRQGAFPFGHLVALGNKEEENALVPTGDEGLWERGPSGARKPTPKLLPSPYSARCLALHDLI